MADPEDIQIFRCVATTLAVRDLLLRLRAAVQARGASEEDVSTVEIAVAEALNNVVEHALPDRPDALITLRLMRGRSETWIEIEDPGRPLPGMCVPECQMADVDVHVQDLPEGGFGWGLIHAVTDALEYQRMGGVNSLRMWFTHAANGAV